MSILDWASDLWVHVTEAQAAIIGSAITAAGAIIAVAVARYFLNGKIATLDEGIQNLERMISSKTEDLESTIETLKSAVEVVKRQTAELDIVLAAVSGKVGQIAGAQAENEMVPEAERRGMDRTDTRPPSNGAENKQKVRDLWWELRDYLEKTASDPMIDGNSRAKYMRTDRADYGDLIDALYFDGRLTDAQRNAAKNAFSLFKEAQKRSIRRNPPSPADVERMSRLKAEVVKH